MARKSKPKNEPELDVVSPEAEAEEAAAPETAALGLGDFSLPPSEAGLSLDDLSNAFAQLMGEEGAVPYEPDPMVDGPGEAEAAATDDEVQTTPEATLPAANDEACELCPRTILEALLFVGSGENRPLVAEEVAGLMRGVRPQEIHELVQELNADYERLGKAYQIKSIGAGYRLELRDEFGPVRDKFYGRLREARLSQTGVDILAIVAYNQPISRAKIDQLRGQPSGAVLNQLVRRQLLAVVADADNPRQPAYRTTRRFLEIFGLESLSDLPQTQEL